MKIYQPVSLNELGGRGNNEDSIFPVMPMTEDRLFLVCDGVGGSDKGEVASMLVCKYISELLLGEANITNENLVLENTLRTVESKINEYKNQHIECEKMSTTLTLLRLHNDSALVAWVGDSRVYHIRNGKILYKTKDHSRVQYLVSIGEITEEEAQTHPERNIIERSVSGNKPTRIDQKIISAIKANDFFLLCTDGILENLNDLKIEAWFTKENSVKEIQDKIWSDSKEKTKDNYSMILVKVQEVKKGFLFKYL